ncbi:MAG: hypothetical protein Q4B04_03020 [bacterium]|nr:hypothetical protein [bacterium]
MAVFKKQNDIKPDNRKNANAENDGFYGIDSWENRKQHVVAHHALTKDELLNNDKKSFGFNTDNNSFQDTAPLFEKFLAKKNSNPIQSGDTDDSHKTDTAPDVHEIEEIKMESAKSTDKQSENTPAQTAKSLVDSRANIDSLLKKCMNFINDIEDNGEKYVPDSTPKYSLKSVDEILSEAEKSSNAEEIPMKKFDGTAETQQTKLNVKRITPDANNRILKPADEMSDTIASTQIMPELISENSRPAKAVNVEMNLADTFLIPQLNDTQATQEINVYSHIKPKHAVFSSSNSIRPEFLDDQPDNDFDIEDDYEQPEEHPIEDYNCIDDAERIRSQLRKERSNNIFRLVPSIIITVVLLLLNSLSQTLATGSFVYHGVCLALISIAAIINFETIKSIKTMFSDTPNSDVPSALTFFIIFIQSAVCCFILKSSPLDLYALATLSFSLNLIVKLCKTSRISNGFEVIANTRRKHSVTLIKNPLSTLTMSKGIIDGDALIAAGRKTVNINGYVKGSYSNDPHKKSVNTILIVSLLASTVLAVIAFLFVHSADICVTLFALSLSIICSPVAHLVFELPMKVLSKKLSNFNSSIAGYSAVETLSECNAVCVNAAELFPANTIKLFKLHPLSSNPIDKSLLDAAAIAFAAKSPLYPVFEHILGDQKKNIPIADDIKFEKKMGISGWVKDRRVFVGNYLFMEAHNIPVPNPSTNKRILSSGYFPVYIAYEGKPCVLLIVGYEADEDITENLRKLCNTGVVVLVNSCDPNLTDAMLADYFGLYQDSIKILSHDGSVAYKSETNFQESSTTVASYEKNVCGMLCCVASSNTIKNTVGIMLSILIAATILGIVSVMVSIISSKIISFGILTVIAVKLAVTLILSLFPFLAKP